jgi:hypothetical protein
VPLLCPASACLSAASVGVSEGVATAADCWGATGG